jgi:hypothetical protein
MMKKMLSSAQIEQRRNAGKARAAQPSFLEHNRRIASLGGKAVLDKYGPEHFRELGKKGVLALAVKLGTDVKGAMAWLVEQGLKAQDPFPANGAWQEFNATVKEVTF